MCLIFAERAAPNEKYKVPNMKRLIRQLKSKKGQTLVEYALILAFISVVAIAVLVNVGTNLKAVYTRIDSSLSSAQASH